MNEQDFKNCYAVIFTAELAKEHSGYHQMAEKMVELAKQQKGFLDITSVRENGLGITVSYWKSLSSIKEWKKNTEHLVAQKLGKKKWYAYYSIQVCKIEKSYNFTKK